MTALAVSNASMLDEGTAAAEAMTLARRTSKSDDSSVFLIDKNLHAQTKAVVITRAKPLGIEVIEVDALNIDQSLDYFGVLVQYPDTTGTINDFTN